MTQRFVVGTDGELPQELLKVVRILLGGEGEHDHDHDDDEDEHAAHAHEEAELELEAEVLGMLGSMLEGKLAAIGDVETEGCRPEVVRDCKVYRDGESLQNFPIGSRPQLRRPPQQLTIYRPESHPARGNR